LDEVQINFNASRHTIDNSSDGLTVTLAKGGQSEYVSESVGHGDDLQLSIELRSIIGCTSAIEASFIAFGLHDN
jgi:hypothetical protein